MVMPLVALRMLAAISILLGVVFAGGAMAKTGDRSQPQAVVAQAEPSGSVATASAPAPAVAIEGPQACSRKVKVVYAGYGEADRASCSVTSSVAKID